MILRAQYKGINSDSKEEENPRFYERDLAEAFMQDIRQRGGETTHKRGFMITMHSG